MNVPPSHCKSCGASLTPGALFCENCGTPVIGTPPPSAPPVSPPGGDATVAQPFGPPPGQTQVGGPPPPPASYPALYPPPPPPLEAATVAAPPAQPGGYPPPAYQGDSTVAFPQGQPPVQAYPPQPPLPPPGGPAYPPPQMANGGYPPPPQMTGGYSQQPPAGYPPLAGFPPPGDPGYPYAAESTPKPKAGFRWWIIPILLVALLAVVMLGMVAGALLFPNAVRGILPSMPQPVAQLLGGLIPTLTPTPTPTPSPTPRPTATFTPQPTATRPPSTNTPVRTNTSPRPTATVVPYFNDTFTDPNSGWSETNNNDYRVQYIQRRLLVELKHNNLEVWMKPPVLFKPSYIDATFEIPFEFETKKLGYMGAYCSYQDDKNYYSILVDLNTSAVKFSVFKNGVQTVLSSPAWINPPAKTPLLKNGSMTVSIECLNGFFTVFVGDSLVLNKSDKTFPDGDMRVVVGTFSNVDYPDGFPLMFSEITVYR